MASFCSRSLQYKKLSCLQRGQSSALYGHGSIAILYHPHHHWQAWFRGEEKLNTALEVHPLSSFSAADRLSGSALWTHPQPRMPSPPRSETQLHGALGRGTGDGSTAWNQGVEVSLSPAESNLSLSPAESNLSQKEPTWAEAEPGRVVRSIHADAVWNQAQHLKWCHFEM